MRLPGSLGAVMVAFVLTACTTPTPKGAPSPTPATVTTSTVPTVPNTTEPTSEPPTAPTTRPPLDVRPVDGWFSVTFTCMYAPDSPQGKWSDVRDWLALRPNQPTHPPGWYDANDLHGATRLAIFGIWSYLGDGYRLREKAEDGLGATGFGLSYTLSRQIPNDTVPWGKNLVKTLAVLDGSMEGGGCVYERAPVLPDRLQEIRDRANG